MKVGDLVVEHIGDMIGIVVAINKRGKMGRMVKVSFTTGFSGWYPTAYLGKV